MGGVAKIKLSCCLLSNVFGNRFWTDFGVWLKPILGPKWPSEATSKARVIKYENQEGSASFGNPPPIEIFRFGRPSVRGKQGEPHRPMLPLTGSADFSAFRGHSEESYSPLFAPFKFSVLGTSVRGKQGEPHRPM